jgi:hypothetical protein
MFIIVQWRDGFCEHIMNLQVTRTWQISDNVRKHKLFKKNPALWRQVLSLGNDDKQSKIGPKNMPGFAVTFLHGAGVSISNSKSCKYVPNASM